jgi:Ribonuclease G/E
MSKELFISSSPHETKVAVLEDDQLMEVYYERDVDVGLVGSIYKGRVSRVLPGMQSAFVNIGLERDAFLYVSDFFEDEEEYDKVFSEAEARATRYVEGAPAGLGEIAVSEPETSRPPAPPAESIDGGAAQFGRAAPAETPGAPAAPAGGPPVPAKAAGEPAEVRRYEPRGKRHRRRGLGERKFGSKPEAPERAAERPGRGAPHTFEILPGESLAKYSDAVPSAPPEEPSAVEPVALEAPPDPPPAGETPAATGPEPTVETVADAGAPGASGPPAEAAPAPAEGQPSPSSEG